MTNSDLKASFACDIKILPYKSASESSKTLAEALGVKRLKLTGSKWKPKGDSTVINWGNSGFFNEFEGCKMLNGPELICQVSNKLLFFNAMAGADFLPQFWTKREDIPDDVYPVVCRTILNGHSGAGIVIADTPEQLVDAPLYVRYVKKVKEFRIHVGRKLIIPGLTEKDSYYEYPIIAEQQKVAKKGQVPSDWKIRSHKNGFVYQRQGIDVPVVVRSAAIKCLAASGLDFGAVDCIYTKAGEAFVLEVNTAPGLEGQTVLDYATFFKEIIK